MSPFLRPVLRRRLPPPPLPLPFGGLSTVCCLPHAVAFHARHKNTSYSDAFAFNTAIEGRVMAKASQHGMQWCCEWLNYALGEHRGCP